MALSNDSNPLQQNNVPIISASQVGEPIKEPEAFIPSPQSLHPSAIKNLKIRSTKSKLLNYQDLKNQVATSQCQRLCSHGCTWFALFGGWIRENWPSGVNVLADWWVKSTFSLTYSLFYKAQALTLYNMAPRDSRLPSPVCKPLFKENPKEIQAHVKQELLVMGGAKERKNSSAICSVLSKFIRALKLKG